MSLHDDLVAARAELAGEFSQADWHRALLDGWRRGLSVAWCLARAAGIDESHIPDEVWEAMKRRAAQLVPQLAEFTISKQPVRVWIANHATFANDALWDGDYEKALRLLGKGGRRADSRVAARREVKKLKKEATKGKLLIRARQYDKRSDWGTLK